MEIGEKREGKKRRQENQICLENAGFRSPRPASLINKNLFGGSNH